MVQDRRGRQAILLGSLPALPQIQQTALDAKGADPGGNGNSGQPAASVRADVWKGHGGI